MQNKKRKNITGFTLIELMIVVAIIAIIAAIGYPAYGNYVIRGKRSEGRSTLLDAAALLERYYSDNNQYAALATVGIASTSENGHYNITQESLANSNQTYTLRATPTFTDGDCGYLEITQAGDKTSESGTTCWTK